MWLTVVIGAHWCHNANWGTMVNYRNGCLLINKSDMLSNGDFSHGSFCFDKNII